MYYCGVMNIEITEDQYQFSSRDLVDRYSEALVEVLKQHYPQANVILKWKNQGESIRITGCKNDSFQKKQLRKQVYEIKRRALERAQSENVNILISVLQPRVS